MNLRWIGAICVILGCGGVGYRMAWEQLRQERLLRDLIQVLDFMERELSYRLSPIPQLCRQAAGQGSGVIFRFFLSVAQEMDNQISPDAEHCMRAAIGKNNQIPEMIRRLLIDMSRGFGRFELDGQLKALCALRKECAAILAQLLSNKENRLRSYQTLGLCAGAAIVILFI